MATCQWLPANDVFESNDKMKIKMIKKLIFNKQNAKFQNYIIINMQIFAELNFHQKFFV